MNSDFNYIAAAAVVIRVLMEVLWLQASEGLDADGSYVASGGLGADGRYVCGARHCVF